MKIKTDLRGKKHESSLTLHKYTDEQQRLNAKYAQKPDGYATLVRCFVGAKRNWVELCVKDEGYAMSFIAFDTESGEQDTRIESVENGREFIKQHPVKFTGKAIGSEPLPALGLFRLGYHDRELGTAAIIPAKEFGASAKDDGFRVLLADGSAEIGVEHDDLVELFVTLAGVDEQPGFTGRILFKHSNDCEDAGNGMWYCWTMEATANGWLPWILSNEAAGYTPEPLEKAVPAGFYKLLVGVEWWLDGLEPDVRKERLAQAQKKLKKYMRLSDSGVLRVPGMTAWAVGVANGVYFSKPELIDMKDRVNSVKDSENPEDIHRFSIFDKHDDSGAGTWVGYVEVPDGGEPYWWNELEQEVQCNAVFIDEGFINKMEKTKDVKKFFGISPVLSFSLKGHKARNIDIVNLSVVSYPAGEKKLMIENSRFLRQSTGDGKWEIVLVEEGLGLTGLYFGKEVLEKEAHKFKDCPIYAWELVPNYYDHIPVPVLEAWGNYTFAKNQVGRVRNPVVKLVDGKYAITGIAEMSDTSMNNKIEADPNEFGFSIDTEHHKTKRLMRAGKIVEDIKDFGTVVELSIVSSPAAGGRVIRRLAASTHYGSERSCSRMEKYILECLMSLYAFLKTAADLPAAVSILANEKGISEATVKEVIASASEQFAVEGDAVPDQVEMQSFLRDKFSVYTGAEVGTTTPETTTPAGDDNSQTTEAPAADAAKPEAPAAQTDLETKFNALAAGFEQYKTATEGTITALKGTSAEAQANTLKDYVDSRLRQSRLPDASQTDIRTIFGKLAVQNRSALDEMVDMEKQKLGKLSDSGRIRLSNAEGGYTRVEIHDQVDRLQSGLDAMFGVQVEGDAQRLRQSAPKFRSIREAYNAFTDGLDPEVRGYCDDIQRLRQATTADFTYAMSVSMTKRAAQRYKKYQAKWQLITSIGSVSNFKQQEIVRWGGFGVLETITQSDSTNFPTMGFPGDVRATYTPIQKGGLIPLTRVMIKNDDMKLLSQIPDKVADAAHETLNRFVFDLLLNFSGTINAGTIYDSLALYHAYHNNIITTAYSYAGHDELFRKMEDKWEYGFQTAINNGGGYSSSDTSIVVDDGGGVQIGDYGELRLVGSTTIEIVYVSGVSTHTLTVVRGQFGTTAASITDGDEFRVLSRQLPLEMMPILVYPKDIDEDVEQVYATPKRPGYSTEGTNKYAGKFTKCKAMHLRGDSNNYYLVANPQEREGIIVEFVDGQQEPLILLQDAPTAGNVFLQDVNTFKVRHEYGGVVADETAIAGAIVP